MERLFWITWCGLNVITGVLIRERKDSAGVQSRLPQNVPRGDVDCFKQDDIHGPKDSGRTFCLSLNCLEEFKQRAHTRIELTPKIAIYIKKIYLHGVGNNYLPIICSSHFLEFTFLSFEITDSYPPLLSSDWNVDLNYLIAREPLMVCGAPVHRKLNLFFFC